jgi:hypothetical protein
MHTTYTPCSGELFLGSFPLFFSPFLKIGQINPSLQSTGNPSPLHTPFISSTILSTILLVPYIHASFCTPSLPGAFHFFKFPICLSTSSDVISVSSGAVCFSFICVPTSPSSFLPSSSFMKYSSHSWVIPFSFSLGLCISTPPSLFLFLLSLSPPSPSSASSSLYISLCIFFSLQGICFCRFLSSSILSSLYHFLLRLLTFSVPPSIFLSCPF